VQATQRFRPKASIPEDERAAEEREEGQGGAEQREKNEERKADNQERT
jgi:hypothetical protein